MGSLFDHKQEISKRERFEFGKNWAAYLEDVDKKRIAQAVESLKAMLETQTLSGRTFIDVGSGSGLFSLAARRMGAQVTSFDYDPLAVACTKEMKQRFLPDDPLWIIKEGSALDVDFLSLLGTYDVVYSWGVLHHTGAMWWAIQNTANLVKPGGKFFVAIYNDQGRASRTWRWVKQTYNQIPNSLRWLILYFAFVRLWGPTMLRDLLSAKPFITWKTYILERGMSPWHDVVDWVGGYPFEVAKPEEVFECCKTLGFHLEKLRTCGGGLGCNEFVFRKND